MRSTCVDLLTNLNSTKGNANPRPTIMRIQFRYIFIFLFRQHTVQNKVVFLPIVASLDCGSSPANPKGRWEEIGSGLVAVYKSDWERFHGMVAFTITIVLWCIMSWSTCLKIVSELFKRREDILSNVLSFVGICYFQLCLQGVQHNASMFIPLRFIQHLTVLCISI